MLCSSATVWIYDEPGKVYRIWREHRRLFAAAPAF
jgi:hypothetical protein